MPAKKRSISPRKPDPRKVRRAFRFKTHDAVIRVIRHKGKSRIIRIVGGKDRAISNYLQHLIFHSLYPENSITPIGVGSIEEQGRTRWGMISESIKPRSRAYKEYLADFYNKGGPRSQKAKEHVKFSHEIGDPLSLEIFNESGIFPDYNAVNVANSGGKPVFFEVSIDSVDKLGRFIERSKLPEKEKVKLRQWIGQYVSLNPENY